MSESIFGELGFIFEVKVSSSLKTEQFSSKISHTHSLLKAFHGQKKNQFDRNGQKKRLSAERNNDLNTCTALWAEYTNMALGKYGKASTLLKQANSIINSDKITKSKSEKGKEFNEHKDILQQVLDEGQCPGTTKRGAKATGIQG